MESKLLIQQSQLLSSTNIQGVLAESLGDGAPKRRKEQQKEEEERDESDLGLGSLASTAQTLS